MLKSSANTLLVESVIHYLVVQTIEEGSSKITENDGMWSSRRAKTKSLFRLWFILDNFKCNFYYSCFVNNLQFGIVCIFILILGSAGIGPASDFLPTPSMQEFLSPNNIGICRGYDTLKWYISLSGWVHWIYIWDHQWRDFRVHVSSQIY